MLDFGFYNMDCMDGMKEFPDKYFDLAIVDVPYGIGENGNKNHSRSVLGISKDYKAFYGEDLKAPGKEYFNELFRVSKNQIIWGANHFISRMPIDSHCWIVWDKENGENDFADCELAWTSFESAVRIFRFRWQGMLQGDMKNKEYRIHPTQKPVALYQWLLNKYAKENDIILDTHVGSASSLIACHNTNHKYVGFELDETYYRLAKQIYLILLKGDKQMEEDMYMVINDNNTIMASRMNLENTLIFVEGYYKRYYDEPRLTVTIERMPKCSGENEDG